MRGFISRRAGRHGRVGMRLGGRPRFYAGRSLGPYWAGISLGGGRRRRPGVRAPVRRTRSGAIRGKRWYRRPLVYRYRRWRLAQIARHPVGRPAPLPCGAGLAIGLTSAILTGLVAGPLVGLFWVTVVLLAVGVSR